LLGIGSLIVGDALGPGQPRLPGNMFVPIDLLKPILGEMRASGTSHLSRRAWLGVNCVELAGQVRVVRVTRDSPADRAGLEPGDHIVRIDGLAVAALKPFYLTLWRGGSPEREVTLDVRRGTETQTLRLRAVDRMKTLRQSVGI
jgi:serine protease Do